MLISVVISTKGSAIGRTGTLLASVASCFGQESIGIGIEVILVFDGVEPDDGLKLRLGCFPVRIFAGSGTGVNSCRNIGAEQSSGEWILFLDDDCVLPDSRYIERLAAAISADPGWDVLGGKYESSESAGFLARGYNQMTSLWIDSGISEVPHGGARQVISARNLLGGNLACRASLFRDGHRFNCAIRSGGDETEFLRRMEYQGYRLGHSTSLAITHINQESIGRIAHRGFRHGRAAVAYSLADPGGQKMAVRLLRAGPGLKWRELLPFLFLHRLAFQAGRIFGHLRLFLNGLSDIAASRHGIRAGAWNVDRGGTGRVKKAHVARRAWG